MSSYREKTKLYHAVINRVNPSGLYLKYHDAYLHFMIFDNKEFDEFRHRYAAKKLNLMELEELANEYEKVRREFYEGIIGHGEGPHGPRLPHDHRLPHNASHGMTISSVFNNIDKEAQKRKVEEIMNRNREFSTSMEETLFEENLFEEFCLHPERFVDRLLEPDYEEIHHFADASFDQISQW